MYIRCYSLVDFLDFLSRKSIYLLKGRLVEVGTRRPPRGQSDVLMMTCNNIARIRLVILKQREKCRVLMSTDLVFWYVEM